MRERVARRERASDEGQEVPVEAIVHAPRRLLPDHALGRDVAERLHRLPERPRAALRQPDAKHRLIRRTRPLHERPRDDRTTPQARAHDRTPRANDRAHDVHECDASKRRARGAMRHARGRARDDDDAEIDDGAARGDDGQRERRVRASDAMRASEREMAGDICARAMMGADARKRDRDATRDGPLKLARSGSGTWRSARRTTTDGGARMRETNVGCRRT